MSPTDSNLPDENSKGFDRPQYHYCALEDASSRIRLLRVKPASGEKDPIECSLITCDLETAPLYAAASYTWGDPESVAQIWVEGSPLPVRENCRYLLWQFRLNGGYDYYWVDAICINQQDLDERNCQVAMMWKIYARAESVLISLPGPFRDIGFLAQQLRQMEFDLTKEHAAQREEDEKGCCMFHLNANTCTAAQGENLISDLALGTYMSFGWDEEDWYSWYLKRDRNIQSRMCSAALEIQENAYWTRLWIVQEVVAARKLKLLCGPAVIMWDAIIVLFRPINTIFASQRLQHSRFEAGVKDIDIIRVGSNYESDGFDQERRLRRNQKLALEPPYTFKDKFSFTEILKRHSKRRCSDVRDRIFGILSLPRDDQKKHMPLPVNYRLDKLDLALSVMEHKHPPHSLGNLMLPAPLLSGLYENSTVFEFVQTIASALELDLTNPAMAARNLCRTRHRVDSPSIRNREWLVAENQQICRSGYTILQSECAVSLSEAEEGGLCVAVSRYNLRCDERYKAAAEAQQFIDFCDHVGLEPPMTVTFEGQMEALVPGATRAGDSLLRVRTETPGKEMTLVARPCRDDNSICAIIGQAIFVVGETGAECALPKSKSEAHAGPSFLVYCSAEDILLLMCRPWKEDPPRWTAGVVNDVQIVHDPLDESYVPGSCFESGFVRLLSRVCATETQMSTFAVQC